MARLTVRRLLYDGDLYYFESPTFSDGIVIVEGPNGTGKTTFADLIYFGLGGNPQKFQLSGRKRHAQVAEDSNNFVELDIELNGSPFRVKRFIGHNDVAVFSANETVGVFPINRRGDNVTFSDWVLQKLSIETFTLHFSNMKGKINITDLMRLIYYDQQTPPEKVFKELDTDSTLVADSTNFRKAIFEVLIGHDFSSYYRAVDELKSIERRISEGRGAASAFGLALQKIGETNDWNLQRIEQEISEVEDQHQRLSSFREKLRASDSVGDSGAVLPSLQKDLETAMVARAELVGQTSQAYEEKRRIQELRTSLISEVTHIKKIMFAHEQLNLFSEDTCPYCLGEVHRDRGRCICGAEVDEARYARFFYNTHEYMSLLKAKQKNVATIEQAISSCSEEIGDFKTSVETIDENIKQLKLNISKATSEAASSLDLSKLDEIDSKIIEVRSALDSLQKHYDLEKSRQELEDEIAKLQNQQDEKSAEVERLGGEAREQMVNAISAFNDKYNELLCELVDNCRRARLDAKYMPVVNDGDHIEASAVVPIRMMYFLTLLSLSLDDEGINYPRFILMDTPDTAGIDDPNLKRAIARIPAVALRQPQVPYQVILTTGVGLYPDELSDRVVLKLNLDDRLLKRKTTQIDGPD